MLDRNLVRVLTLIAVIANYKFHTTIGNIILINIIVLACMVMAYPLLLEPNAKRPMPTKKTLVLNLAISAALMYTGLFALGCIYLFLCCVELLDSSESVWKRLEPLDAYLKKEESASDD